MSRSILRSLLTAAVLLGTLSAPTASLAADTSVGFSVAPLRIDTDVRAGGTGTHQVTITNTTPRATRYTFSREDFHGDKDEPNATPQLLGGKFASAISGYDWLDVPDPVTIPAGQTRTVAVKVKPPADAKGGHYAALIVEGDAKQVGELVAQSRIAVLFLMNAGNVPPPEIVITEITEVGPGRTVTRVRVRNDGQTDTTPKPIVTVRDPVTGRIVRRYEGECPTILPNSSAECVIDETKPGTPGTTVGDEGAGEGDGFTSGARQKVIDVIGEDEGTAARGELPTEWAGAWTSMLLPLVGVALFVLYFMFLRRRRKDEEELALDGPDWSSTVN